MKLYTDYRSLPPEAGNTVVALGNFDGVHLGHAGVIARTRQLADELKAPLGVLTFEPHPRTVFRPADPPFRLSSRESKARRLAALGVDCLYVIPFSREFSLKSAAEFEREVLGDSLGVKGIVAGANFHFGRNRGGTLSTLSDFGEAQGFPVVEAPTLADERGEVYSSTRIRQALAGGQPDEANRLLGYAWEIDAVVERGDQRGRELGYKTANGQLGELLHPAYGIYAVRVEIAGDPRKLTGIASIGIRPMWQTDQPQIETHIFDFDEDIYGKHIRVSLIAWQRPEIKFKSVEDLKRQMALDCAEARIRLTGQTK